MSGTVTGVTSDPKTFTVQDKKGKEHQFKVTDQSSFTQEAKGGKVRLAFDDIHAGLAVKVTYRAGDVATDVRVQQSQP